MTKQTAYVEITVREKRLCNTIELNRMPKHVPSVVVGCIQNPR